MSPIQARLKCNMHALERTGCLGDRDTGQRDRHVELRLRHFDSAGPHPYVRAMPARANAQKSDVAATAALIALARVLARQVARDWLANEKQGADAGSSVSAGGEQDK